MNCSGIDRSRFLTFTRWFSHSARYRALSLLVFTVMMIIGWWLSLHFRDQWLEQEKTRVQSQLNGVGTALTSVINRKQALLTGLAAFAELHAADAMFRQNFEIYAAGLQAHDPLIRAIQIFPPSGPVMLFPTNHNEAVQRRTLQELIQDDRPMVRRDVERAIQTRQPALSNPYELRQGGRGVIARLAVYRDNQFWGLVTVVLNLDSLWEVPGINPASSELFIALKDTLGQVFHGDEQVFLKNPVLHQVPLLEGAWTLAAVPRTGWLSLVQTRVSIFRLGVSIAAVLLGLLAYWIGSRQAVLALTVRTQTRQLGEREENYRLLFEEAADGIFIANDKGKYLEVNPSGCALLGYTLEELLQLTPGDLSAVSTPEETASQHQTLKSGRSIVIERSMRHKNGSRIEVEISERLLPDGRVLSFVRNITERKRMEGRVQAVQIELQRLLAKADESRLALLSMVEDLKESAAALRERETLLRIAGRAARLGGWMVDLAENRMIWSDEVAAIHETPPGYSPRLEEGINFYAPEWREKIAKVFKACAQDGLSYDEEMQIITARGRYLWVRAIGEAIRDESGKITRVQGAFQDISERKQLLALEHSARLAADAARERATQILERISDGFGSLDTDWRYTFVNEKLAQMVGRRREDLIGRHIWTEFPEAVGTEAYEAYHRAMTEQRTIDLEHYYPPFNRWFVHRFYPSPEGLSVFIHDVTERRHAEGQVRQLNAELEQRVLDRTAQLEAANKELEAFSYSVSHDLRAPLRAINGYARILDEDYGSLLDAEGRRVLGVIRSEALRMGQLIDDLLQFSRLGRQPLRIAATDMSTLAREVFEELLRGMPERKVDFRLGPLPEALADRSLLRQVWVNLLDNALKYSRPRETALIEISGRVQDGEAVYCVQDNGTGFEMKYAGKLFGVFQRLHAANQFEGTGVGLALVQRIVHRHHGRVWAEAEPDSGARFYFSLPQESGVLPAV